MLYAIDMMQTGGCIDWPFEKRELNEDMLNEKLDDCKSIILYFVGEIANGSKEDSTRVEMDMISRLYWLHNIFENFKTPPELFEKKGGITPC